MYVEFFLFSFFTQKTIDGMCLKTEMMCFAMGKSVHLMKQKHIENLCVMKNPGFFLYKSTKIENRKR